MRRTASFLALAAGFLIASGALAQDLAPLSNLSACRAEPAEKVNLSFSYEGGACQETDEAKAELLDGASATISVPTHNNAEICTMQVVQIDYAGTIDVPVEITALNVQVLNPDGEVQAGGKTDVLPKCAQ